MTGFQEIDAAELHAMLAKVQPPLLVDVRNDDEVARSGVIEGAVHIPLHLLPVRFDELEGDAPLVIYCHAGVRSAQACSFMASKGREGLNNLRGGVMAWANAGYPFQPKK